MEDLLKQCLVEMEKLGLTSAFDRDHFHCHRGGACHQAAFNIENPFIPKCMWGIWYVSLIWSFPAWWP